MSGNYSHCLLQISSAQCIMGYLLMAPGATSAMTSEGRSRLSTVERYNMDRRHSGIPDSIDTAPMFSVYNRLRLCASVLPMTVITSAPDSCNSINRAYLRLRVSRRKTGITHSRGDDFDRRVPSPSRSRGTSTSIITLHRSRFPPPAASDSLFCPWRGQGATSR